MILFVKREKTTRCLSHIEAMLNLQLIAKRAEIIKPVNPFWMKNAKCVRERVWKSNLLLNFSQHPCVGFEKMKFMPKEANSKIANWIFKNGSNWATFFHPKKAQITWQTESLGNITNSYNFTLILRLNMLSIVWTYYMIRWSIGLTRMNNFVWAFNKYFFPQNWLFGTDLTAYISHSRVRTSFTARSIKSQIGSINIQFSSVKMKTIRAMPCVQQFRGKLFCSQLIL